MKCFKICHVFGIGKPKYFFLLFNISDIHCLKSKVAKNEKQKKKLFGFTYSKNMAFQAFRVDNFVEHKPVISKEWIISQFRLMVIASLMQW